MEQVLLGIIAVCSLCCIHLLVLLLTLAGNVFTTSLPVDDQLNCVMFSKFNIQANRLLCIWYGLEKIIRSSVVPL
jgi:hypothetical protein